MEPVEEIGVERSLAGLVASYMMRKGIAEYRELAAMMNLYEGSICYSEVSLGRVLYGVDPTVPAFFSTLCSVLDIPEVGRRSIVRAWLELPPSSAGALAAGAQPEPRVDELPVLEVT